MMSTLLQRLNIDDDDVLDMMSLNSTVLSILFDVTLNSLFVQLPLSSCQKAFRLGPKSCENLPQVKADCMQSCGLCQGGPPRKDPCDPDASLFELIT